MVWVEMETLEPRQLFSAGLSLSDGGVSVVARDLGDYHTYQGEQQALLRVTDEIAVGWRAGSGDLTDMLTQPDGTLAGFESTGLGYGGGAVLRANGRGADGASALADHPVTSEATEASVQKRYEIPPPDPRHGFTPPFTGGPADRKMSRL